MTNSFEYKVTEFKDDSGKIHCTLKKRVYLFFWKTISKGSKDECLSTLWLLVRKQGCSSTNLKK